MVVDLFDSLLQELGQAIKIKDLKLDGANTCLIKFANGLMVHIEPFEKGDFMLISTKMPELLPGRFQEEVMREALKSNGLASSANQGIFGYSEDSKRLIFFGLLSLRELNGEKIAAFLGPFLEKAESWKKDIELLNVPVADKSAPARSGGFGGLFGLRP